MPLSGNLVLLQATPFAAYVSGYSSSRFLQIRMVYITKYHYEPLAAYH